MKKTKTQDQIWIEYIKKLNEQDFITQLQNPSIFHVQLKEIIQSHSFSQGKVIEIGSGTGTTSYILDDTFEKTLFDLNLRTIILSRKCFTKFGRKANFIIGNMF